jgi:hypothetical protein
MFVRMIKFEMHRMLKRRKLLAFCVIAIAVLAGGAVEYLDYGTPQRTSLEAFSFSTALVLPLLLPILASLLTGDSLAEDHRMGLLPLIISRGIAARVFILCKAIASVVTQVLFFAVVLLLFLLALTSSFPEGPIFEYALALPDNLAVTNPLAYCLGLSAIYAFAAAAFAGTALLVSVWVKNSFVAVVSPTVMYVAVLYLVEFLAPEETLLSPYMMLNLLELRTAPSLLYVMMYWIMIAIVMHALAVLSFCLRRNHL